MQKHWLVWLFTTLAMNAHAAAAGLQSFDIPADVGGPAIRVAVWYPSEDRPSPIMFGAYTLTAAKDGAISGRGLPLIVMSPGRGGTFVGNNDTAQYLANEGFVVVSLNHPGDTASDKSRIEELSIYLQRPRDVARVIDHLTGVAALSASIDPGRIGIYGFSRGGYTGLVAVGAKPNFLAGLPMCAGRTDKKCGELRAPQFSNLPMMHDHRIKAAVIVDPLTIFFTPESFSDVTVPVQLWASETGFDGVEPKAVDAINAALKAPHTLTKVEHSQHFSFTVVCPASIADQEPVICKDPPGLDRGQFHLRFNASVAALFRTNL
ncbi:alpha/beta hydrolase family protein [Bradyrhizobium liaoningense]|uniref:alpha/beta hydrolase family protein n=1 Tax=Bradyrhizobium liaoningense TaxID=43992 RepID=UPI001BA49131|nr:prolyl oligopeptidase family serine peptidase [Bradyrhizobium liaoningense]MBR0858033.1 prolyl oligopeptidase family serine peptidase [Bradyrhizobium liaoningense]